jgi:chemotaxis protein CheX
LNADLINPFLSSAMNVLETMAFTKAVPGKPFLKKEKTSIGDITGVIGLTGHAQGSIAVSFSQECALFIVAQMLDEEFEEVNEEVQDAVGEMTNMISGDARRLLSEKGYNFQAGIPTIIVGPNHTINHIANGPCIVIPFKTEKGGFVVEACISG